MYQNPIQNEHDMEVEFLPQDQIEDSDMEETDVKVCDICGDCGKEDSLATCCRCSDGAEHIYCMREMLDEVPDGDWMCEECKYMDLVTNEKPLKIGRVDETETNNSNGQESSSIINSCYIEAQRTRACMRTPGKGLDDDADAKVSLGELERPTLHGQGTLGVLPTFVTECTELKSKQANPKEEDISLPIVSEAPPLSEDLPNGLSQSSDFASSGVRMIEHSGNYFQPSSIKSSKDEGDILKAAIEAALRRKPGLCQKRKTLSQPEDSSFISTVAHRTGLYSGAGGAVPIVSSDGKSSLRETFMNIQVAMPVFLKTLIIPAHEYIWQGSFEICRSDKISDSWDGIQAHMSRLASPKVMEAVNKFKNRIILYEVPRSSTWPLQFQEHGVTEDNVALFFFAKDVESYNKIYKLLLDNMMKNDLALKGNFNGVELLIFPSNQLPDNFQRWNRLFFLWGVFRGEKQSCSQHIPEPLGQHAATAPEVLNAAELCSLLPSETLNGDCSMKNSPSDHPDGGHLSSPTVAVQSDDAKQCQGLSIMSLEGGGMRSSSKTPSTG